jgi:hypothetical protein
VVVVLTALKLPLPDDQPIAVNALRNKRSALPATDPASFPRCGGAFTAPNGSHVANRRTWSMTPSASAARCQLPSGRQAQGHPPHDRATRREFVSKFHNLLQHMGRRGQLDKIGSGRGARWKLTPIEPDLI